MQIEVFFDIGSAYSYLASTQLDALAARTGATLRWRPFLLGAVFKATGNDMPARIPAKARWLLADTALWAELYAVPYRLPSRFPLNTLRTQRALSACERLAPDLLPAFTHALFRAYWVDDQDVSADPVLTSTATATGLDPTVLSALDAPETKDLLRATTDEAVRRGAFGAPSLFLGDRLFFGNDRLPLLERALTR